MTWADVKRQIEAAGVLDTDEVQYIDISVLWGVYVNVIRDGTAQMFRVDDCFEQ